MKVEDGIHGVRQGRGYVQRQVEALGAEVIVDDVVLVAAELLANAVQHGRPPVVVEVSGGADLVRVEVADADPRPPVRPLPSTTNMTGRGLSLVQALAARWGVEPVPRGGKTVWAELVTTGAVEVDDTGVTEEELLAAWADDDLADGVEPTFAVELGEVPTDLLISAKAHIDNLVREFSLLSNGGAPVPAPLAALIESVRHDFAGPRDSIKRQGLAAAHRGDPMTHLSLRLPLSAADAGERYLAALDQADAYARAEHLLTVAAPESHRRFRRWYVAGLVDRLRAAAGGLPPAPPAPFRAGDDR